MIKDAIEKVNALNALYEHMYTDLHGVLWTDRSLQRVVWPCQVAPAPIIVNTLSGLREYVAHSKPATADQFFLIVENHRTVKLVGGIQPENDNTRFCYAKAIMHLDDFVFGNFVDLETFIISLQSLFVPSFKVESVLNFLGSVVSEQVKENNDDGFSQSIQIRVGINMKAEHKITNPISLQPWRTFREVEQPESKCLLRLKERDKALYCGLFIADGNTWQLGAIKNIKDWLIEKMPDIPVIG